MQVLQKNTLGQMGKLNYRMTTVKVLWWLAKYVQLLWSVIDKCLSEHMEQLE